MCHGLSWAQCTLPHWDIILASENVKYELEKGMRVGRDENGRQGILC